MKTTIIKRSVVIILITLIILNWIIPVISEAFPTLTSATGVKVADVNSDFQNSNITYKEDYIRSDDVMPYALYTPSTANKNQKTPLIVWLHGARTKTFEYQRNGY